ncbi:MAG: HIRAN domain-containing protein [Oscillospiraceae bacterium]|nr:HIRAN domain-containing protein [Oscillospiraceae bacterium]
MNNIRSKVMTAANRLVKSGMTRSAAMAKAWALAKADGLRVKVSGTSFRQKALKALAKLRPQDVTVLLRREPHNRHDSNAVAVYATVPDRHMYFIGYLAKAAAFVLAPLMDKGKPPEVMGVSVIGGFNDYVNYGARLAIRV